MKKTGLFLAALLFATGVAAQNPTSYFMEGSTFRSHLNPAFAPLRGYVNVPGLGNININASGNMALDKVLYPRNGRLVTLLDSSVSAAQALSGLKSDNIFGADTRVNIIGFGAFTRNHKNFWSFDLNLRANADANLPYSLFEFLKRGQEGSIKGIGLTADTYLEAGFNYSFPVGDKLYIGVRGKFLAGAARARLYFDRFDVTMKEDIWEVNADGRFDITAGGVKTTTTTNDKGEQIFTTDDIDLKPTKPAGYGFAVDLGATYDILPNLQASLAVTDLGFISWGKGDNLSGISAKHMTFTGVEVDENGNATQPDFDLDMLDFVKAPSKSVARMLHTSINAGLEYEVWRHKIGIGLLYTARIWQYRTMHNITGSVNFHPVRWFTLTGSYSVIDNRAGAVGLALNLNPNWINFYIATDVLTSKHTPQFIPIRQSIMNVTLGLGIPIGKRSHRIAAYIRSDDKR